MYRVNISIDDISPHPLSSDKVLEKCYRIIEELPDVKFTLFVPMAYQRMNEKAYPLDQHKDFCQKLNGLSEKNFELGWHGFSHGIEGKSNNNEFAEVDYKQALKSIDDMFKMAEQAGIIEKMKPIFRPSAFRMSPSSFRAFDEKGIRLLALTDKPNIKSMYEGNDVKFSEKNKVVFFNVCPPYDPIRVFPRTEMVFHACEWLKNYLSDKMADELIGTLKGSKDIEFCFIEDL